MTFGYDMKSLILDLVLHGISLDIPHIEIALGAGSDFPGLMINEPSGNGYARKMTSFLDWESAVDGVMSNSAPIVFNTATGDWGDPITDFALHTTEPRISFGMVLHGELDTPITVVDGTIPRFAPGALQLTLNGSEAGSTGSFSNYMETLVLDHLFWKDTYTEQFTYLGLCNADPGEGGTGEFSDELPHVDGYERVETHSALWNPSVAGLITNAAPLSFPMAEADWGLVTHLAIYDDGNYGQGNLLMSCEIQAPVFITVGTILKFDIIWIDVELDVGVL